MIQPSQICYGQQQPNSVIVQTSAFCNVELSVTNQYKITDKQQLEIQSSPCFQPRSQWGRGMGGLRPPTEANVNLYSWHLVRGCQRHTAVQCKYAQNLHDFAHTISNYFPGRIPPDSQRGTDDGSMRLCLGQSSPPTSTGAELPPLALFWLRVGLLLSVISSSKKAKLQSYLKNDPRAVCTQSHQIQIDKIFTTRSPVKMYSNAQHWRRLAADRPVTQSIDSILCIDRMKFGPRYAVYVWFLGLTGISRTDAS